MAGRHVVIVGRSDIVGRPLAMMLGAKDSPLGPTACNATVTICHSQTPDLAEHTRRADILVAAMVICRRAKREAASAGRRLPRQSQAQQIFAPNSMHEARCERGSTLYVTLKSGSLLTYRPSSSSSCTNSSICSSCW